MCMYRLLRGTGAHGLVLAPELPAEGGGAPALVLLRDHRLEGDCRISCAQHVQKGGGELFHHEHLVFKARLTLRGREALQPQQISDGMGKIRLRHLARRMCLPPC